MRGRENRLSLGAAVGARVIHCGGWRGWPMMAIPGAKQQHGLVDQLCRRRMDMVGSHDS
jgi:hypothetical protein